MGDATRDCRIEILLVLVALVGEGKGPGCGFKIADSHTRSALKTIR